MDWTYGSFLPPHMVLALGIIAVQMGTLLLVLGRFNRADPSKRRILELLYIYLCGLVLVSMGTLTMEFQPRVYMHSAVFYRTAAIAFPLLLVAVTRPVPGKWKTTKAAAVYMVFWCAMNWILPLFPAEPKLGPVYNPVTHFVPATFPLVLVLPAAAIDLFLWHKSNWPPWSRGLSAGTLFLAVLLAVEWPFADFLMGPWARNAIFQSHLLDYATRPTSYTARNLYFPAEPSVSWFWASLGIGLGIAMLEAWAGLKWGAWLTRVKR